MFNELTNDSYVDSQTSITNHLIDLSRAIEVVQVKFFHLNTCSGGSWTHPVYLWVWLYSGGEYVASEAM
eukprot:93495-Amorphochlora_amoeboformis.AAC.3